MGFSDHCRRFIVQKLRGGSTGVALEEVTPNTGNPELSKTLPGAGAVRREAMLFKVAFVVAFFGILRVSDLVPMAVADRSPHALNVADMQLFAGMVSLYLRYSKTLSLEQERGLCGIEGMCR